LRQDSYKPGSVSFDNGKSTGGGGLGALFGVSEANAYTGTMPGPYGMELTNLIGGSFTTAMMFRGATNLVMSNPAIFVGASMSGMVYGVYKGIPIYAKEVGNYLDNASPQEVKNYCNSLGGDDLLYGIGGVYCGVNGGANVSAKDELGNNPEPMPIFDINNQKEFVFKLDSEKPDPIVRWVFSRGSEISSNIPFEDIAKLESKILFENTESYDIPYKRNDDRKLKPKKKEAVQVSSFAGGLEPDSDEEKEFEREENK
jgi:hypothetical protein